MTTNKIEKVSGQMMQEDFPNTASNYKIFKDSNGKEYYSCIDHRNKSNGMIVDSNFNLSNMIQQNHMIAMLLKTII